MTVSQCEHRGDGQDVVATLMYAGSIAGRAQLNTVDPSQSNLVLDAHEVVIHDARSNPKAFTLDEQGFAFVQHASVAAREPELFDSSTTQVSVPVGAQAEYCRELIELVRDYTGASLVLPQLGSFVARASQRATKKTWAGTAGLVHLDYTRNSAENFMRWTLSAHGMTAPPHRHFAFIQTWRALSPGPQDNSLCVCDGSSVSPEDAVPIDAIMGPADVPGKCFEFRLCRHGAGHTWYYLSNMALDDVLLFKGYDSRHPRAMTAMHSAFDNPLAGPDAAPRRSIEARFLAFFE